MTTRSPSVFNSESRNSGSAVRNSAVSLISAPTLPQSSSRAPVPLPKYISNSAMRGITALIHLSRWSSSFLIGSKLRLKNIEDETKTAYRDPSLFVQFDLFHSGVVHV